MNQVSSQEGLGGSRWLTPCIALALGAVTLLVYWPARHFAFLNWDDLTYISRNDHVRGGLTWNGFLWSFTHSYSSNWHPLTWLSHMLDCQFYGLNPEGPHLTNVALHAANSVLLFLLLRALTAATWRSAFVAALFALHPLHVESVAWVAERKDVLSGFFFMLTLLAYERYVRAVEGGRRSSKGQDLAREAVGSGHLDGSFPLTPALSLGEREGARRSLAKSRHRARATTLAASLPLPKGEGRGEGEQTARPPATAVLARCSQHPGSGRCYLLALVMFALGLMSKPMLVTLPFVLLLLDYWPLKRNEEGTRRRCALARQGMQNHASRITRHASRFTFHASLLLEKLPFFALSAASCVVTFLAQKAGGAVASFTTLPFDARLATAAIAYIQYLAKLFWPFHLSPIYPHPDHWGFWPVTGAVTLLILLTATAWWGRRRFPYGLVGWLWYLGMLVPVIGIVQVGSQAYADRYTYLPLIGVMIALVWLGVDVVAVAQNRRSASPPKRQRTGAVQDAGAPSLPPGNAERLGVRQSSGALLAVLSLVLLAGLAWRTRTQLPFWKDTRALFSHALALAPNSVQALYGLGATLVDAGQLDEGKRLLERAIELKPAYPEALGTMAMTLDGQGKYAEAIRFYRAALKAQPNQEGVLNNLAWLLASCPDAAFRNGPEAVRLATRACELTGFTRPLLIGTLAAAQAEAGNFQAAIATAQRAEALATALRLEDVAARNRELIQLYRQGQPFHEKKQGAK